MEKNRCSLGKFYIFVEFSGVTAALIILNVLCRLSVMESGISKFSRTLRAQITPKVSQNLKNGKLLKNLGIWVKNGKLSKVSHFFGERNELVKGMTTNRSVIADSPQPYVKMAPFYLEKCKIEF